MLDRTELEWMDQATKTKIKEADLEKFKQVCKELDDYQHQLEKISPSLLSKDPNDGWLKFREIMISFRKYLAKFVNDDKVNYMIRHSNRFEKYWSFFSHKNLYYMSSVEYYTARDIIAQHLSGGNRVEDLLEEGESIIYDSFVLKAEDFRDVRIDEASLIVCVGHGPIPETMLHFRERMKKSNRDNFRVLGLDTNQGAVNQAADFFGQMGYSKEMEVQCIDGKDFDYTGADIVFIPAFIFDKKIILERILKTNPTCDIYVENYEGGLYPIIFKSLIDQVPPEMEILSVKTSSKNVINKKIFNIKVRAF